jgi:hypothetical protein
LATYIDESRKFRFIIIIFVGKQKFQQSCTQLLPEVSFGTQKKTSKVTARETKKRIY